MLPLNYQNTYPMSHQPAFMFGDAANQPGTQVNAFEPSFAGQVPARMVMPRNQPVHAPAPRVPGQSARVTKLGISRPHRPPLNCQRNSTSSRVEPAAYIPQEVNQSTVRIVEPDVIAFPESFGFSTDGLPVHNPPAPVQQAWDAGYAMGSTTNFQGMQCVQSEPAQRVISCECFLAEYADVEHDLIELI
jgi:hypothetical protein